MTHERGAVDVAWMLTLLFFVAMLIAALVVSTQGDATATWPWYLGGSPTIGFLASLAHATWREYRHYLATQHNRVIGHHRR